jgi:hypothetical protein
MSPERFVKGESDRTPFPFHRLTNSIKFRIPAVYSRADQFHCEHVRRPLDTGR